MIHFAPDSQPSRSFGCSVRGSSIDPPNEPNTEQHARSAPKAEPNTEQVNELNLLVGEVADEIDRHPAGTFAVTGPETRNYFRAFAARDLQAALASARHRYWTQCTGLVVLPLPATEGAL